MIGHDRPMGDGVDLATLGLGPSFGFCVKKIRAYMTQYVLWGGTDFGGMAIFLALGSLENYVSEFSLCDFLH